MKSLRFEETPHAKELQERVWDWASRNLLWITRHNAAVGKKITGVRRYNEYALEKADTNELANHPGSQQMHDGLTVSALALRPALDTLLKNYGSALIDPPTLEEAVSNSKLTSSMVKKSLIFDPTHPGEDFRPPRIAFSFLIDEIPLSKRIDRLYPIDPKTKQMACWFMTGQAGLPSPTSEIPEVEAEVNYRPLMNHVTGLALDLLTSFIAPFNLLTIPGPRLSFGVHTNASQKEMNAFFKKKNIQVIDANEILKSRYAATQLEDRYWERYTKDVIAEITELWSDKTISADERIERFKQRAHPKLGNITPEDRLGDVLKQLELQGEDPNDLLAHLLVHFEGSWSLSAPIWWVLADAIRNNDAVRSRVVELGIDRGRLAIFERRFALCASRRGFTPQPLDESLSATVPAFEFKSFVAKEVGDALNDIFPVVKDGYVVRIEDVFEEGDELHVRFEALFSVSEALTSQRCFAKDFQSHLGPCQTATLLAATARGDVETLKTNVEKILAKFDEQAS